MTASTNPDVEKGYRSEYTYQPLRQHDPDDSSNQALQTLPTTTPPMRRPLRSRITSFAESTGALIPKQPRTYVFIYLGLCGLIFLVLCFKSIVDDNPPI
ncbi:hypothetical protein VE00_02743 [Pseudogymnoascus sp. WSF 3629]|nr:hypothetical protein VE00_02743 [Pseudogymnoascus sp. WSF 3629]